VNKYYKTGRAYKGASRLPRFINSNTDSSFFNLLNIPHIEMDYLYEDIIETSDNVIPSSLNLSLPAHVFQTVVDTGVEIIGAEEVDLYNFTYGLPTGLSSSSSLLPFPEDNYLDIHFLSPLNYIAEEETFTLAQGYVALTDGDTWFDQKIKILDIAGNVLVEQDLPIFYQNLTQAVEDEWVSFPDDTGEYVIKNETYRNLEVIEVASMEPLTFGIHWNYADVEQTTIKVFEQYKNKSLVVEYEFAPFSKLISLTYLKDFHSILTNTAGDPYFTYLDSTTYTETVPPFVVDLNHVVLFKDQFVTVGSEISGEAVIDKHKQIDDLSLIPFMEMSGEELMGITPDSLSTMGYVVDPSNVATYDTGSLTLEFNNYYNTTPGEDGYYGEGIPDDLATWDAFFTAGTYIWDITFSFDSESEDAGGGPVYIKHGDTNIVGSSISGTLSNQYTAINGANMDLVVHAETPVKGEITLSFTRVSDTAAYYYADIDVGEDFYEMKKVTLGPYSPNDLVVEEVSLSPENPLVYSLSGSVVRLQSYTQYNNFNLITKYCKKYTIESEKCILSSSTYMEGDNERNYLTLDSLDSIQSTGGVTSLFSGTFTTEQSPHKSIAWYQYERHIEENIFSKVLVSLSANNFIELYNLSGDVLNRFPLEDSPLYEFLGIRRFGEYACVLKKDILSEGTLEGKSLNKYILSYYNIQTMELEKEISHTANYNLIENSSTSDWGYPLSSLGDELFLPENYLDYTFASSDNWVEGAGWNVTGGFAEYDGSGGGSLVLDEPYPAVVAGRSYELRFHTSANNTVLTIKDGDGGEIFVPEATYTSGTKVIEFVAPATTTGFTFVPGAGTIASFDLDWVNLKELTTSAVTPYETTIEPIQENAFYLHTTTGGYFSYTWTTSETINSPYFSLFLKVPGEDAPSSFSITLTSPTETIPRLITVSGVDLSLGQSISGTTLEPAASYLPDDNWYRFSIDASSIQDLTSITIDTTSNDSQILLSSPQLHLENSTMEYTDSFQQLDTIISNVISFSFDKELHPILFGKNAVRLMPEYKYYTRLASGLEEKEFVWFREDNSNYESTKEITEHAVDHWGRVMGNDRWPKESLKDYLSRLTSIAVAHGNTSYQNAINGLSAEFAIETYNAQSALVYKTTKPMQPVNGVYASTLTDNEDGTYTETLILPAQWDWTTSTFLDGSLNTFYLQKIIDKQEFLIDPAIAIEGWDIEGIDNVYGSANNALQETKLIIRTESAQLIDEVVILDSTSEEFSSAYYRVKYKPLMIIDNIIAEELSSITYSWSPLSSHRGLFAFSNLDNKIDKEIVNIKYYTRDLNSDSEFVNQYSWYEDEIEIDKAKATPGANDLEIIMMQDQVTNDGIPAEYTAIMEEATNAFEFKWGDFNWDKYSWADGEGIKTGIPTIFDADTKRTGSCDDPQYITESTCLEHGVLGDWTLDPSLSSVTSGTSRNALRLAPPPKVSSSFKAEEQSKSLHVEAGAFYYKDFEYYLYPAIPKFELLDTPYTEEGSSLLSAPTSAGPMIVKTDPNALLATDTDTNLNLLTGGCNTAYTGVANLNYLIPNYSKMSLPNVEFTSNGNFNNTIDFMTDWSLTASAEYSAAATAWDEEYISSSIKITAISTLTQDAVLEQEVGIISGIDYVVSYWVEVSDGASSAYEVKVDDTSIGSAATGEIATTDWQFHQLTIVGQSLVGEAHTISATVSSLAANEYIGFTNFSIKPVLYEGYLSDVAGSGIDILYETENLCIEAGRCVVDLNAAHPLYGHPLNLNGVAGSTQCTQIAGDYSTTAQYIPYTWEWETQMAHIVEGESMKVVHDYNNTSLGYLRPIFGFNDFSEYAGADSMVNNIIESHTDPISDYTYSVTNVVDSYPIVRSNLADLALATIYAGEEDSFVMDTNIILDEKLDASGMLLVVGEENGTPVSLSLEMDRLYYTDSDNTLLVVGYAMDNEGAGLNYTGVSLTITVGDSVEDFSLITDRTGKFRKNIDISNYSGVNLIVDGTISLNEIVYSTESITVTYIEEII
tara:strand:+ start:9148 stop:15204 length:6057 start_codon:yes stop_codon:yes gene_type:complete